MKKCGVWMLLALVLCRAANATESLTLSEPSGQRYAGEVLRVPVTGDNLRRVTLRLFRLKGTAPVAGSTAARVPVSTQTLSSQAPTSRMVFSVRVATPGWFQAEAFADNNPRGTAFDEITFSVAKRPAKRVPVPTLQISGPEDLSPPGTATFEARGELLKSATLRVWKLLPGGAQQQVFAQVRAMPPVPRKGTKAYDYYEPVIKWAAPLRAAGTYLVEATSQGNLKRLKYVRVSDIGLVSKRAPGEMLVYAVRLSTGAPIPNIAIRVDDSGLMETRYRKNGASYQVLVRRPDPSRAARTGADGVARFYKTPGDGTLRLSASAPDGSRVYGHEAYVQEAEVSERKVLFYTERPLYRPGQTVFFKGVARRDLSRTGTRGPNNALFVPIANAQVEMEWTDAANEKFATLKATTNADGAFAGKVTLSGDAAVGRYSVETKLKPVGAKEAESFYNRFLVQEYRKPEYEVSLEPQLSLPYAIQGTPVQVLVRARYLFGGPVKSARIEYSGDAQGDALLNDNGEALITLPNPVTGDTADRLRSQLNNGTSHGVAISQDFASAGTPRSKGNSGADRTLNLTVKVTDDANRIVTADTSIFAPYALLRPTIALDKNVYNLQDSAKITVRTRDPLGRVLGGSVRLRLFYTRQKRVFNREKLSSSIEYEDRVFFEQNVQTDRFGVATLDAKLGRGGYIRAEVSATDRLGRVSTSEGNIWVLSKNQPDDYWGRYEFPEAQVLVDRESYRPGERVRALVTTQKSRGFALVTLQGDRIFFHRVVKLVGRVTPIEFVFPEAAAPGAYLVVGTSQGRQWAQDSAYVRAVSPAQSLNIAIRPDKREYRPGTKATYAISVKDGLGRPQKADVSFGLVDKAIYSLAADETPSPIEFFFGTRENRVSTTWQFPGEVAGGSYQRIEQAVPVRRNFQDTAFWNPFVLTNAQGLATLSIDLPDNLTQWRATARGLTADTRAGSAIDEITVTKPLLTRLIVPRFTSQTDRVRAQVIVQNNTPGALPVRVSLRGDKIQVLAATDEVKGAQNRTVAAGQSASFFWTFGADEVPIGGKSLLVATARTGDAATSEDSDAQEIGLPLQPRGFPVEKWASSIVRDGESTWSLAQEPNAVRNASRLEIAVAPSVAGPMLGALPPLIQFPYGCTEQTLSRFVPSIAAARAIKYLKLPAPEAAKDLPAIVQAARSTLYSYQHRDGGWGWWPDDDTDPYLTAYAVYGLSLAKEAGYEIDRDRILRGVKSIQNQFAAAEDADGRAFLMLAHATAREVFAFKKDDLDTDKDFLGAVFEFRAKLSPYGRASLALAHSRALKAGATPKLRAQLKTLLDELESSARREEGASGPIASWPTEKPDASGWNDSDIEATALALQVLSRERPNSPLMAPVVSWLLQSRRGLQWRSTKDTAQVVIALADFLRTTDELEPDETVQVLVNGVERKSLRFTKADVGPPDARIVLDGIDGDAQITIKRSGRGVAYVSSKLTSFKTSTLKTGEDNGLKITRRFQLQDAKGHWRDVTGAIPSGALVRVDLRVQTNKVREYLLLEDLVPAGFEARPEDDAKANTEEKKCDCEEDELTIVDPPRDHRPLPTDRREGRDNRQAWFVDELAPGKYFLRYILRPEQPGTRVALPARAEAMYRPEINGHSDEAVLEVK